MSPGNPTLSFLRIPPFPGARTSEWAQMGRAAAVPAAVVGALCDAQVGGTFWGPQPVLGEQEGLVLAPASAAQLKAMLHAADRPVAGVVARTGVSVPAGIPHLPDDCDPWHLSRQAGAVWADADQDLALVAALAGRPVRLFGQGRFTGADQDAAAIAARTLGECHYLSPFDGSEWSALQAIEQLRQWRHLIDANRAIDAVVGVARWKRVTLDPLLWNGTGPVPHTRRLPSNLSDNAQVVVWKSRTPARLLAELEASGAALGELEDGFIRSTGLGANCVPPLSAIVDFSGVYFDPANPSDLETLLEYGAIGSTDCERAAALKERLVATGITKYGQGSKAISTAGNGQRRILVTGQVEDDRSILSGGKGLSNLELLQRVRALESGAWIVYKPHPDVEAGHRNGFVPSTEALRYADEIQRDAPITALIDAVDGLHVITSLAGFEALLRGKPVTTHGVPFYAGWGLTRDLGDVPPRRTRKRSLDELVAATLLLYPRYLDPITRLPCHAELLVERMAAGEATVTSPLVTLREWQGRAQAMWRRMVGGR